MKTHNFATDRAPDLFRGRTGTTNAGVGTILGSAITGTPTTAGDTLVYDPVTDAWVIVNSSTFGVPLTVEDEGTPLTTSADTLNFVGAGVTATGSAGTKTITIPSGGGGTGTPGWFSVKDPAYGAVGDGTTDDTAAINLAIAALNSAGKGVLYFPAGTYKITAALTAITALCLIQGDGMGEFNTSAFNCPTSIRCTSQTAVALGITAEYAKVRDLAVINTYGGTPTSASAGIKVSGGSALQRVDFDSVLTSGFYINIDVQVGFQWTMRSCHNWSPVKYGVKVRNTVNGDFGDWTISESAFYPYDYNADAAVRWESSGGGKVIGCKFNSGGSSKFVRQIDAAFSGLTSVALIATSSFENYSGDAVHLDGGGSGFQLVTVTGCQFGHYSNSTGRGIYTTAISDITIANLTGKANSGTPTFISLNSGSIGRVSSIASDGFGTVLATSSFTSLIDGTGGVAASVAITGTPTSGDVPIATSGTAAAWGAIAGGLTGFATPAIVLGTAAAAGAATTAIRSDSTIVAFDATVPVTQALGDTAATGSTAKAARRDHTHGMPTLSSATPLVESGAGSVGTALPSSREDHVHPAAGGTSGSEHAHVVSETHLSNGSTVTWTLDQNYMTGSVIAWNVTTLARLTVTEVLPDQATVSAAGTTGDLIVFDYAAIVV